MISPEEKKKVIEDMIKMSYQKIEPIELQRQLHAFLLKDTNGGKLYKYRSFDKDGYSLKNLQDGTLHCSKADAFNDPFECKIGVTFQSLCTAMYGTELDVVSKVLEDYVKVVQGESRIEEYGVDEKRVIKKLLTSKILNEFFANKVYKVQAHEEMSLFLKNNAFVIAELMCIFRPVCTACTVF